MDTNMSHICIYFGQDNVTYLYPFSHICDILHGSCNIFACIRAGRHRVMSLRIMSHLWVMAHVWMSYSTHMEKKMTHKSEWQDAVILFPNGYKYVMWLMKDVTNMSKWLINLSDMTHRTEWHDTVVPCRFTQIYEPWHTCGWGVALTWIYIHIYIYIYVYIYIYICI